MPLILHLETATEVCSAALSDAEGMIALVEAPTPYAHAAQITLLVEECLRRSGRRLTELDAVSLSRGPGSYTALRVGAATAKGICYALDKPLIAVDTLRSLAAATRQTKDPPELWYCPMIDARRMEVYHAVFDARLSPLTNAKALVVNEHTFAEDFERGQTIVFSGNGAPKCQNVLRNSRAVFRPIVCSAAHLIPLAHEAFREKRWENLASFTPLYLKPPNITVPKKIL
jgi:tRNA threonylcarbamoyladenosine biosynthesis protein TsaB